MLNLDDYIVQLVAIINLSDLLPTDPTDDSPAYVINVLAKHPATSRIEVLVLAKNPGGINQFLQDFPNAGELLGDGTPDHQDEWQMLAYPTQVHDSTSPLEIFLRGKTKAKNDARKGHKE